MFSSGDREISRGEQNLDGEPSWMAGGLLIPTTAHAASQDGRAWSAPITGFVGASTTERLDPNCRSRPGFADMWVNVFDHTQIRHTRQAPSP